jgi:aldehyde:ferredoxin oxidoreductase
MPLPPIDPRGAQGLAAAMVLNPAGPRYDVVEHDSDFDLEVAWPRHVLRGSAYGVPAAGLRMGTLGPDRTASLIGLWQLWSGLDVLGVCIFASPPTRELDEQDVIELATAATGEHVGADQLVQLGRQRLAVQRRLNHSWGVGEASERLPDRFHDRPVRKGRLRGTVVDREEFRATLTALREHFGWGDPLRGADDRDGVSVLAAAVRATGVTT